MDELAQSERAKYEKAWGIASYAAFSPGLQELAGALRWMRPDPGAQFTDWGSGSGKAADALVEQGFKVRMVDIAANAYRGQHGPVIEACLWDMPADLAPTKYGYCADVMEHIPSEKVDAVLSSIAARTEHAVFFQIALYKDSFGAAVGEPLHLSVFPAEWWSERLLKHFAVVETKSDRRNLRALCLTSAP
jgi:hypothetical protein